MCFYLQVGSIVRIKDACGNCLNLSDFPLLHVCNSLRTSLERSFDRQSFVCLKFKFYHLHSKSTYLRKESFHLLDAILTNA